MVNSVNFNIHYYYGEEKTLKRASPNHNIVFSTDTDIGSKYTDRSVRNTEHNFTRLEALYASKYILVHNIVFEDGVWEDLSHCKVINHVQALQWLIMNK